MSYGLRVGLGEEIEERLLAAIDRIGDGQIGRELVAVRREVREVLLAGVDAVGVRRELAVADAADLGVDLRAAELLLARCPAR